MRALQAGRRRALDGADLSALRLFGSTGEPWNREPYLWLFERVGGGTRPIVNISGGTEVVACFLAAPHVSAAQAVHARTARCSGMDVDVFDADRAAAARRGRRAGVQAALAER